MADQKLSALTELTAEPASNDEVYIRDVSEAAAAESKRITVANLISGAGGAADYPMKVKPAMTRWVIPGWYVHSETGRPMAADKIYYIPIFVEETTTYIRIGVEVDTAVAGNADLRIFNWSAGLPDTLVLSAGTVDTGSTGKKEITISQELTRGYYFLAVRCSSGPTLEGPSTTFAVVPPVTGLAVSQNGYFPNICPSVSSAYADPAPAPTSVELAAYCTVQLREN